MKVDMNMNMNMDKRNVDIMNRNVMNMNIMNMNITNTNIVNMNLNMTRDMLRDSLPLPCRQNLAVKIKPNIHLLRSVPSSGFRASKS